MIKIFIFSLITNLTFYSYGHLIKSCKVSDNFEKYCNKSILGFILISFIALTLNFFFPLNDLINTTILIIGIFILFIIKKVQFEKDEIIFIAISAIITTGLILYSTVNRPDAGLYHLPFTSMLNEHRIVFGSANIHFRFGHISIIQYVSAANKNYLFDSFGILIPLASIISFFVIFFFSKIFFIFKSSKEIDLSNIFSIFIIIFISYKINRYSSFGNDAVAHVCFFYLITRLLSKDNKDLYIITLISVFIFLNKSTMMLSLVIPFILFFKYFDYKNLKILFSLPSFFLLFWLVKNVFISGCLVYPIEKTCFTKLNWTDINEVKSESIQAEAWSKGFPDRKDLTITVENFKKNFVWFDSWFFGHGIKILKILIPYFLISIIIFFFLGGNKNPILISKDKFIIKILLLLTFFGSILFFLKFPLFRYGYSYIISFFILIILYFKNKYSLIRVKRIAKFVFIICFCIFSSKQFIRYFKNQNIYNYWPEIQVLTNQKKKYLEKIKSYEDLNIYFSNSLCMYSKSICTNYELKNIKITKKYGYYFINLTKT